jgi:hypothetical protein
MYVCVYDMLTYVYMIGYMHTTVRRYTYICMSPLHKTIKREQYFEIKQMVCSDGDPIPSGNHLALLCNGYRCCMQRDQNGNFPPVTTNQICVCCKKPLHPICGLFHERTSFLTCCIGLGNDELLLCGAMTDQMQTMKKQGQVHFLRFPH